MGLNGPKGDQGLARAALRNHSTCRCLLPAPDQAHDSERLRRVRLSKSDHGKGVAKILKPRLETSTVEVEEGLLAMVCRFIQTRIRENVLIVVET